MAYSVRCASLRMKVSRTSNVEWDMYRSKSANKRSRIGIDRSAPKAGVERWKMSTAHATVASHQATAGSGQRVAGSVRVVEWGDAVEFIELLSPTYLVGSRRLRAGNELGNRPAGSDWQRAGGGNHNADRRANRRKAKDARI